MWNRRIAWFVFAAGVLVVSGLAITFLSIGMFEVDSENDPREAARYIGLSFPDDAAQLHCECNELFTLICRFAFETEQAEAWLSEQSFLPPLEAFSADHSPIPWMYASKSSPGWWDLREDMLLRLARFEGQRDICTKRYHFRCHAVLVSHGGDRTRVYIDYAEEAVEQSAPP